MRNNWSALRVMIAAALVLLLMAPATAWSSTPSPSPSSGAESSAAPEPSAGDDQAPDEPPTTAKQDKVVAAAADAPRSQVGISKETSLGDTPLTPGQAFTYTITVRCSGLTVGCVNQTVTDVLPEGLEVTSVPQTAGGRTVTFDDVSRALTVHFDENLQEPVGEHGLNDGATRVIEVGVRLPADTSLTDGTPISNTATTAADNADPVEDTVVVNVSIPRAVRPVATKSWSDGSAIAGSDETSTATLGVRNASTGSVVVDELTLTDATPATYENFDLTGVELTSFPAGADRAQLLVCTVLSSDCESDDYTAGFAVDVTGTLTVPNGVDIADVTGFAVRFFAADGSALPYDATGGTIKAGYQLRDDERSTGEPIKPTVKQTVSNCAVPSALVVDEVTDGSPACDGYDIQPDAIVVTGTKSFFADTNGSFDKQNDEHAVVGENSPVSATVGVTNKSAFPLGQLSIVEPDENGVGQEFDKLDVTKVRLRFPQGATGATLIVEYDDPTHNTSTNYTSGTTVDVAVGGARVTRVEVVYIGDDDGSPSIGAGATGWLDLHGNLNDQVTSDDLPNAPSSGVGNCASFTGAAESTNSTGATAGNVCATLQVEAKRLSGTGVKTNGQNDIPPGQPIPFSLELRNDGNVPLINPVLTDPPVDTNGVPLATGNPFEVIRVVSASVTKDTDVPADVIEVYDPSTSAWVAYDSADSALLSRATGVRAGIAGPLTPGKRFTLHLVTERRAGVPDGENVHNCFTSSATDWVTADPICSAQMTTAPANSAAVLTKSVLPGSLPRPIPGLPQQTADVKLTVANTGNVNVKRLVLTDADADFFDAAAFGSISSVTFPTGANRIQIDALTDNGWIDGAPQGQSPSYALPASAVLEKVIGIRVTFTHSSGGYEIRPCEGIVTPTSCTGVVTIKVHPLERLRSTGGPIPAEIDNTVVGGFEALTHTSGHLEPIDPVDATLDFTAGEGELDVEKTPDTAISPGETAPFRLTVTNTGTSNLPDLVVKDALPEGLAFDETFVGDGGEPFKILGQVPTGTEPVPTPVFTTVSDGDRVSGLQWDFGDWVLRPGATFTIEVQVTLAPGVTEGQVDTNTMGATSSNSTLTCADGSGTDPDDLFGAGTWCTDTAAVTTKAGAAFQARKWVAGNDDLGWFNNRTKTLVAVGEESCPSLVEGSRTYTAFPCVAMVNPGDEYDYLLRMVNAGTEPATDMRIIDRFPVRDDKGVVLDDVDRGTEWNNRPTLSKAPTLLGSGSLTTTYADTDAGYCVDDLDMGDSCGAGTWEGEFGPDAIAAQMRVAWGDDPLAPGEDVSIAFSMRTPLDVAQSGDPTIAWNSFGHAEKTVRGNGTRILPPTEPIQVGVATAYGTLEVAKKITANPGELPVDDRTFPIDYVCTIDPIGADEHVVNEGTLEVKPGEAKTVTGIPAGATCEVWETDTAGGISNHSKDEPARIKITPQLGEDSAEVTTVTIENSFPLVDLDITKVVDGDAARFGGSTTYEVEVDCSMDDVEAAGFPTTVELTGNDTKQVKAPVGTTCTAVETEAGGATRTAITPEDGILITGETDAKFELKATNTFDLAELEVTKKVVNGGAGPYDFEAECKLDGHAVPLDRGDAAFTLKADRSRTISVPQGADCVVKEVNVPDGVSVAVVDSDGTNDGHVQVLGQAEVTVTNTFPVTAGAGVADTDLADTGGPDREWLGLALTLIAGGAVLVAYGRRRRTA